MKSPPPKTQARSYYSSASNLPRVSVWLRMKAQVLIISCETQQGSHRPSPLWPHLLHQNPLIHRADCTTPFYIRALCICGWSGTWTTACSCPLSFSHTGFLCSQTCQTSFPCLRCSSPSIDTIHPYLTYLPPPNLCSNITSSVKLTLTTQF